jgi:hypothetical protein
MSFNLDDAIVGGQLKVGTGIAPAVGEGPVKVNGSAMIEGPVVIGNPTTFPWPYGALNVAPLTNEDNLVPPIVPGALAIFPGGGGGNSSPYSFSVSGPSALLGNVDVMGHITAGYDLNAQGDVWCYKNGSRLHFLSNKKDLPFDMPHPNKKGWRLRHVCIEGPEIAVYCRGKVPADGIIHLPTFWDGLVNPDDMSISLTPIGCWQELFVKETRWGKQVVVANNAGGPINADYYIVARRLDDDLVVEYEGESHEDYPGGNEGYSFNFEHNYVEGLIRDMVSETVKNIEEKE